uniref:DUF7597 domain-containing protein n=1 Tax=Oryza barthii TaxID=65489 RepID=A0A0D3EPG1_9ORYZ
MANININLGRFLDVGQHVYDGSPNHLFHDDLMIPTPQRSTLTRDTLVEAFGFHYNGVNVVKFRNHDRGSNWRAAYVDRVGWIMFLGCPLDFHTTSYISRGVGLFGWLDYWQEVDIIPDKVMMRAFFDDVPRRIVFKQIPTQRGQGESWTFCRKMKICQLWVLHLHLRNNLLIRVQPGMTKRSHHSKMKVGAIGITKQKTSRQLVNLMKPQNNSSHFLNLLSLKTCREKLKSWCLKHNF